MGWLCGVGVFGLIDCPHSLPALHSGLQNNNNNNKSLLAEFAFGVCLRSLLTEPAYRVCIKSLLTEFAYGVFL